MKADYLHKLEEEKEKAVLESLDKSDKENISDLETLKFLDKADKIALKKTGGGCFIPISTAKIKNFGTNKGSVENQIVVCEVIDVDNNFKEVNEKPKDHNIKKNKFRTQHKTIKETQGQSVVSANKKKGKNI
ncbi:unnamed protein product, partial [Brenthis ino]